MISGEGKVARGEYAPWVIREEAQAAIARGCSSYLGSLLLSLLDRTKQDTEKAKHPEYLARSTEHRESAKRLIQPGPGRVRNLVQGAVHTLWAVTYLRSSVDRLPLSDALTASGQELERKIATL